jgi:hypothetical protein
MPDLTLTAGQPTPSGGMTRKGKFQGWVLIQLWEPAPGDGGGVNINLSPASVDNKTLLHRAADELNKLRSTYD